MIETRVPKDVRKYEAKILGPFNKRQLICLGLGITVGIIVFTFFTSAGISSENTIYIVIVCVLPIMAFAVKIDDMPMEVFIKNVFMNYYTTPRVRIQSEEIIKREKIQKPKTKKEIKKDLKRRKKLEKENPEFRPIK